MSRYLITLHSAADKAKALAIINAAPVGARVEVKAEKRSLDQNAKLWAMLTEVARQLPWHGQTLRPDDWKILFVDALKRELRPVPNLEGTGFVNLRNSSSDLSKEEFSNLLDLIAEFGARHGVQFADAEAA
jgi:hypothetical protein